jgi:hypothetical protein
VVAEGPGDLPGQDVDHGMGSAPKPELGQHAFDLVGDGLGRLTHAIGDLGVGEAVGDQSEQALLPLGQALVQPVAFCVAQARRPFLGSGGRR